MAAQTECRCALHPRRPQKGKRRRQTKELDITSTYSSARTCVPSGMRWCMSVNQQHHVAPVLAFLHLPPELTQQVQRRCKLLASSAARDGPRAARQGIVAVACEEVAPADGAVHGVLLWSFRNPIRPEAALESAVEARPSARHSPDPWSCFALSQ